MDKWVWKANNKRPTETSWGDNEPSVIHECASVQSDGHWYTTSCGVRLPPVCMIEKNY